MGSLNKIDQLRLGGRLPSPKGVALAIMEISRRDDASLDEVTHAVRADPALTARLLRLANGAAHPGQPVVAINDAVMRLGMGTVRQLAMGFCLVDQYLNGPCKTFDYGHFWSHSLLMAVASMELAGLVRVGAPDGLFACGLLAQIGTLTLATIYPTEYAAILDEHSRGGDLAELERARLEVDHNEFTAAIMADCGIPKMLAEPVLYFEAPERSGFSEGSRPHELAHLFYRARCIADLGLAEEKDRHAKVTELMRLGGRMGLDEGALGELFDRIIEKWQAWSETLRVPAARVPSFTQMAMAPAHGLARDKDAGGRRVLLVEDDPISRDVTEGLLRQLLGCQVYMASDGREALALALETMPQIVVTDALMPVMGGLEFCRALRATDWGKSMYVVMLTAVETDENIVEAFEAGVDDYIAKPVNVRALNARMRAALHYVELLEAWERDRAQLKQFAADLAVSNRRLEHTALTDLLTGLPNRRAGMDALAKAWSAAERGGKPVSALMLDVDRFKSINDRYGHAVGDVVLREVARAIQSAARKDDSVCRMGGEEFLLVCHDTDAKSALLAAERLRRVVKALSIDAAGETIHATVSIGVASRQAGMSASEDMVKAADKALYAAKNAGRDRVSLYAAGGARTPWGQ